MITKLRASKIAIETPREGAETWVHITIQQVIKDDEGNIKNIIPRYDYISFPLQDIGVDFYSAMDPLTQQNIEVSGYGTASLIGAIVIKEMLKKYEGTVTPEGDVIV